MLHVSYPPFCTSERAEQRLRDASRAINCFSPELGPELKRMGREWAVGPKHMQHTRNTNQAQDRLLPAEGGDLWGGSRVPMWTPCSQRFFSLIWLLITTFLGTAPLKSIQPISIQTMK